MTELQDAISFASRTDGQGNNFCVLANSPKTGKMVLFRSSFDLFIPPL